MSLDPRRSMLLLACVLAMAGCNIDQQGIAPTPATLNFPIALGLSVPDAPGADPRYLFVVNSNFDLRFNDGTLMALDLDLVREEIVGGPTAVEPCGPTEGEPGLPACQFDDLNRFLADEVAIGSHADGLAVSRTPRGERLYIPSRSNRNLTFVDFDPGNGTFTCGADDTSVDIPRCGDRFRAGNDGGVTSQRELELTGDPVDVAAGSLLDVGGTSDSNFVLLALRNGRIALFVEEREGDRLPTLAHIADGFPDSLVTLTMQPGTGIGWMTSAVSSALGRVGIIVDDSDPTRSFLFDAGALRLGGLDDGQDTRDIAFDPERPQERAFVLARRPESVVALDLTRPGLNASDVAVDDVFEIGAGPSRLVVAELGGRTYAIASTFDARKLFVIDVEAGVGTGLVAVNGGLSGPFAMVVDPGRNYLYVADFSVSVIRVFDLEPLTRATGPASPFLIATLGEPAPVTGFGN